MGTKSIESENVVRGRRINFLGYCFTKDNVRMRKNMKKELCPKGETNKKAGNVTARYELHTGAGVSGEIVRIYGEQ